MKQKITNILSGLLFVAAVMGMVRILPTWATDGIIILLLTFNLTNLSLIIKRNDHDKKA